MPEGQTRSMRYGPKGHTRGAIPEGGPSNHQPIGKSPGPMEQLTIFLLGFHLGFIQIIKSPGPMEQVSILLLGFHLGCIQVIKYSGPMEQLTILLLGFHLGFIQVTKSPGPMEQLTIYTSIRVSMWRSAHGCGKMTYEHSRLAKKVKKGKRPKRMKSADGSLFRLIFLEIRLGTYQCANVPRS